MAEETNEVQATPEQNIQRDGFWYWFFLRLKKMILDMIHIRSLIFWIGTSLEVRFMTAYLQVADKTPDPALGICSMVIWFLLAVGVGWHRTWEDVWAAFKVALSNSSFKKGGN